LGTPGVEAFGVVERAFAPGVPGLSSCRTETKAIRLSGSRPLGGKLTSFVLRFGVDRDELEPERDGGRSLTLFNLLEPAFSPFLSPFRPMLSRSLDSE
jgi:hypothetical protein